MRPWFDPYAMDSYHSVYTQSSKRRQINVPPKGKVAGVILIGALPVWSRCIARWICGYTNGIPLTTDIVAHLKKRAIRLLAAVVTDSA